MAEPFIQGSARNFDEFATSISDHISDFYPDAVTFFSDNTVGQILYESQAAIASNLTFQLQRAFQESRLDYAQKRDSLYTLAKNAGIRVPNFTPSVCVVDITFNVPVRGDGFADEYLPIVKAGSQFVGNGQVFELLEDSDFSSPKSVNGLPNRKYTPIVDSQQNVVRYEVTKREIAINGTTKVFSKRVNRSSDFYTITLPDPDVVSITSVIVATGTDVSADVRPDQISSLGEKWDYVDYLSQSKVFKPTGGISEDGIDIGEWTDVIKKYTYEFLPSGLCRIKFGNGRGAVNDFQTLLGNNDRFAAFLNGVQFNDSLGRRMPSNSTVFVEYRVGGGLDSNVPANTVNSTSFLDIVVGGPNRQLAEDIRNTISVNNPAPAIGGKDRLEPEEIRSLVEFNKDVESAATRLRKYIFFTKSMDGRFGRPDKVSAKVEDNKVVVSILGVDSNGVYTKDTFGTLKNNVSEYLSEFKAINDFVEVRDGKILSLRFDIDLLIGQSVSDRSVIDAVRSEIVAVFSPNSLSLGSDVYLGAIYQAVNSIEGIVNVNSLRVYSVVDPSGTEYSSDAPASIPFSSTTEEGNKTVGLVDMGENALVCEGNEIFEIRDSIRDISISFKRRRF